MRRENGTPKVAGPLALTVAVLLAAVALAGCGGGSHKHAGNTRTSSSATGTSTSPVGASIRKGFATFDFVLQGTSQKMRVTVYDLRRSGPFVILDFSLACLTSDVCASGGVFASPNCTSDETAPGCQDSADGITLVDPVNNKEYGAVLDVHGNPDASGGLQDVNDSSPPQLGWVKFPTPPPSVSSLDVAFPDSGPVIAAVPITNTTAPTPAEVGRGVQAPTAVPFDKPPGSTDTTGLTLPVDDLVLTVGGRTGSDAESATRSEITLKTDVLFRFAKSNLTPAARAIIGQVAARITARATGSVQVTGYTDSIGPDSVNIPLSRARAAAVVRALRPLTPGVAYHAAGMGSADPVAPNTKPDGSDNPAGRALNRRVTTTFAVKAAAKPAPPTAPTPSAPTGSANASGETGTYRVFDPNLTATYTVTIIHLFRTGDLLVLEANLTCQRALIENSCEPGDDFAGTSSVPPATYEGAQTSSQELDARLDTPTALYLIDPSTGLEYIPVYDSHAIPLVSPLVQPLSQGDTYPVWLYFPAPPATTSTITVAMPGGATRIAGVPIATAPPHP